MKIILTLQKVLNMNKAIKLMENNRKKIKNKKFKKYLKLIISIMENMR